MLTVFGARRISISRELTKIYEETLRTTLSEAIKHFGVTSPRGEFVLVIDGAADGDTSETTFPDAVASANAYIDGGLSVKDAVKKTAEETGIPKNTLYNAVAKDRMNRNT
jgi:16S rRNA (cytidine1402-2'-O)-methyltransferase